MDYQELTLPSDVKFDYLSCESVMHINARSVNRKEDDIVLLLQQFCSQFSVLMLSETWYTNSSKMLELDGYNNFFLNRKNSRGGGVAILVAKHKKCEILPEFSKTTVDYEILTLKNKQEIISVLYRPPTGNVARFLEFYEDFLEFICKNNLRLISGGDFNINMLEENNCVRDFSTKLVSSGFINVIKTPTRITCSTSSMLDLIVTNLDTEIYNAGTVA